MTGTVPTLAAAMTRRAAEDLIRTAEATPVERLLWKPEPGVRCTVLSQLEECAMVNQFWAILIRDRGDRHQCKPPELQGFMPSGSNDLAEITKRLRTGTEALAAAILDVRQDELDQQICINSPGGLFLSLSECCLYAYWNMVYHEGQINYIQMLYGDMNSYHNYHFGRNETNSQTTDDRA